MSDADLVQYFTLLQHARTRLCSLASQRTLAQLLHNLMAELLLSGSLVPVGSLPAVDECDDVHRVDLNHVATASCAAVSAVARVPEPAAAALERGMDMPLVGYMKALYDAVLRPFEGKMRRMWERTSASLSLRHPAAHLPFTPRYIREVSVSFCAHSLPFSLLSSLLIARPRARSQAFHVVVTLRYIACCAGAVPCAVGARQGYVRGQHVRTLRRCRDDHRPDAHGQAAHDARGGSSCWGEAHAAMVTRCLCFTVVLHCGASLCIYFRVGAARGSHAEGLSAQPLRVPDGAAVPPPLHDVRWVAAVPRLPQHLGRCVHVEHDS